QQPIPRGQNRTTAPRLLEGDRSLMPSAPATMCLDCGRPATNGRYCFAHAVENQATDNRRTADTYRRENDPFRYLYKTARWARVRIAVLHRWPLCCWCKHKASTVADHIVKARDYIARHGGNVEYFFDLNNLQGMCKRCHDMKTRRGE